MLHQLQCLQRKGLLPPLQKAQAQVVRGSVLHGGGIIFCGCFAVMRWRLIGAARV